MIDYNVIICVTGQYLESRICWLFSFIKDPFYEWIVEKYFQLGLLFDSTTTLKVSDQFLGGNGM